MSMPAKIAEFHNISNPEIFWCLAVQRGMRAVMVKIVLIGEKLSLQVHRRPKEDLFQQLSADTSD